MITKIIVIFLGLLFFGTMSWSDQAFAQMESIRITGNQYPEIDTFFNIRVFVEGISRSSGGLFDIHGTIYEKDNPNWVVAQFVKDVYSGTNTVTIDMKKGDKPYKLGVPYIIEIQHVQIISKFEFTPVEKSSDAPVGKNMYQEIEELIDENKKLKEDLEKKDLIIMEQIKVIQNLAAMIKKTIFEPILNYFSIV
jgi:hypothetical protein